MAYNSRAHREDEEKATRAHDHRGGQVNRYGRPSTYGSSSRSEHHPYDDRERKRSRSPYRRSRERSRSPYRKPKERSRSPYRASESSNKRRHNDDHYNSAYSSDSRRSRAYYDERDREHKGYDRDVRPSNGKYHDRANVRERSRSPYRHDRKASFDSQRPGSSGSALTTSKASVDGEQGAPTKAEYVSNDRVIDVAKTSSEPDTEEPVKLSDAELIEQRRKKREAIKAKHKLQQPLLVQALEQNMTSAPSTPLHDSAGGTPASRESAGQQRQRTDIAASTLDAPQTPGPDSPGSAPFSPSAFSINLADDLVEQKGSEDANGPSAADYDPSMDMQENRRVQLPAGAKADEEVDMFADEDDMFASESKVKKLDVTKSAKTLDSSLLDNWDYADGHYRVIIGELLDGRYAVQKQLGKGTFATVVAAQDITIGRAVAIKIACNNDTMYKAGSKEMDFVKMLNDTDPEDKRHIICLLGNFDHKKHLCLVFEALGADLRETIKKYGRNVGLSLAAIRAFSYQMFQALYHMQKNEVLHADLKPDNILVSEKLNLIKICDFGTAARINDTEITPYLVSRFYRAPEVIIGMPFDYAIDMWSVGCTLFELYTGRILFAGADNNQMLRVIQECRGKIPNRMLKKASLFDKHFDQHGNFVSIELDKVTGQATLRQPALHKIAAGKDLRARTMANVNTGGPAVLKEVNNLCDLLDKCLQLDPAKRISPIEAMKHPFIKNLTVPQAQAQQQAAKKVFAAMAPSQVR